MGNLQKTAVLVAGMHRSGTSAFAQALGLAGCDLPKSLMRQNDAEGRRRGYAESWVITRLNMEMRSSANHHGVEALDLRAGAPELAAQFRERAAAALRDEFGDSRLFVIKDPLLCLLLEHWIDALKAFGARPVVICPIRNPLEVAASINARSGTNKRSINFVVLQWLRYVLDAEFHSRNVPRAFMRYDDLLEDPLTVLGQAAAALDTPWPALSSPQAERQIRDSLSPAYRHHSVSREELYDGRHYARSAKRVFEILDRWSDGDTRAGDTAALDAIRAVVDDVTAVLAEVAIDREAKIASHKAHLRRKDDKIAQMSNSLSWRITEPLRRIRRLQRGDPSRRRNPSSNDVGAP